MSISPWVVGQTHPTWQIPWTADPPPGSSVRPPVDLTGATVTLWIFKRDGSSVQGAGAVTVPTPTNGVVFYQPVAADSPVIGNFFVALKAVYADTTVLWQQPAIPWEVTKLP